MLGLVRAVDWSIDRLHSYDRRQLKRVMLKIESIKKYGQEFLYIPMKRHMTHETFDYG